MGEIVWIASYPKSGNTWLRAFLINLIADRDEPVGFAEYKRFIANEASGHWYKPRLGGAIQANHHKAVSTMRGLVQREIADTGKPYALVKTHSILGHAYGHPQINMDVTAAAIYVVRNPLDIVVSFANHNGATIDATIQTMAQPGTRSSMRNDRVFEWTADWSTHVKSWTSEMQPGLCVVRYEDMLSDPETTFGRIAEFLKIEARAERLERAIRHSSFDQLRAMEQETGFEEKPEAAEAFFRTGRQDQWQDILSREQSARIIARHKQQMARYGYVDG